MFSRTRSESRRRSRAFAGGDRQLRRASRSRASLAAAEAGNRCRHAGGEGADRPIGAEVGRGKETSRRTRRSAVRCDCPAAPLGPLNLAEQAGQSRPPRALACVDHQAPGVEGYSSYPRQCIWTSEQPARFRTITRAVTPSGPFSSSVVARVAGTRQAICDRSDASENKPSSAQAFGSAAGISAIHRPDGRPTRVVH